MENNYLRTTFDMAYDVLVNKLVYDKIVLTTVVIQNLDLTPDKFMTHLVRSIMILINKRILKLYFAKIEEQKTLELAEEQSKVSRAKFEAKAFCESSDKVISTFMQKNVGPLVQNEMQIITPKLSKGAVRRQKRKAKKDGDQPL